MSWRPPVREQLFVLRDVIGLESLKALPGSEELSLELIEQVLEQAGRFCAEVLAPLNREGDRSGCKRLDDGSVETPPGFKEAYRRLAEGGWTGLAAAPEWGGQGMPAVISLAFS
ncbi:MAG: acyl-CoA dehydrogenase N-terminal domain-containing protein, partial [Caulobacteraceae bacterium]